MLTMSDKINRRDVLKGMGSTTAASIAGASIVSASQSDGSSSEGESNTGTRQSGHVSLSDLKVRSFVQGQTQNVEITLLRTNLSGQHQEIASKQIKAKPLSEMKKPLYFDFQIPHGEYITKVRQDGDVIESMNFSAPQTGYPEYRQVAVTVRDNEIDLSENVI